MYRRDGQRNISALIDSIGNFVVKYKYDAWGNHAVLNSSGGDIEEGTHIGNMNPFRYRGYYYDTETGLYYLKSRYYDPETGRFISIDGISYLDAETVNGLNLYAYCLDNPVMFIDLDGCFAISLTAGLIALFGLLVVGTIEAIYHPIGNLLTWGYNSISDLFSNINRGSSGSVSSGSLTMTQIGVLSMLNSPFVTFNVLQYQRKTPAIRNRSKTRKEAKEKARRRGDGAEPEGPHKDENGAHYHPGVKDTDPRHHDHFYFPNRMFIFFLLFLDMSREE